MGSTGGVWLTYDARGQQDGLGAQAQRILGIYGVAKALGLNYWHSGIEYLEPNPGDPFETRVERQRYLERANARIALPSTENRPGIRLPAVGHLTWHQARRLISLHRVARKVGQRLLIPVLLPYPWCDRNPECYDRAVQEMPITTQEPDKGQGRRRIDVHVRRALAPSDPTLILSQRHISMTWTEKVVLALLEEFKQQGHQVDVRIHTDEPSGKWLVPVDDMSLGTRETLVHDNMIDEQGLLRRPSSTLTTEVAHWPDTEICREWDALAIWDSMITADVLVTCASSLSFVAGLMRGTRPVIAPVFWHPGPPRWLSLDSNTENWSSATVRRWLQDQSNNQRDEYDT